MLTRSRLLIYTTRSNSSGKNAKAWPGRSAIDNQTAKLRKVRKLIRGLAPITKQGLKPILFSFSCWRTGAIACALVSSIVLCMHLAFAIWALANVPFSGGRGTLYKGKCSTVGSMMNWIQLLITFVSSLLLGASNYCMQILSAPTRAEIDAAHAKGNWLDIGTHSIRNVYLMSRRKRLLWSILAASSVALHILSV